jgi:hypothetical protein
MPKNKSVAKKAAQQKRAASSAASPAATSAVATDIASTGTENQNDSSDPAGAGVQGDGGSTPAAPSGQPPTDPASVDEKAAAKAAAKAASKTADKKTAAPREYTQATAGDELTPALPEDYEAVGKVRVLSQKDGVRVCSDDLRVWKERVQ